MMPYFIKTVVGAVFSRSSHLRHASTDTMKDHADSLFVIPRLESETNSVHAFRTGAGICSACLRGHC